MFSEKVLQYNKYIVAGCLETVAAMFLNIVLDSSSPSSLHLY